MVNLLSLASLPPMNKPPIITGENRPFGSKTYLERLSLLQIDAQQNILNFLISRIGHTIPGNNVEFLSIALISLLTGK
jgi:hypothetical protein